MGKDIRIKLLNRLNKEFRFPITYLVKLSNNTLVELESKMKNDYLLLSTMSESKRELCLKLRKKYNYSLNWLAEKNVSTLNRLQQVNKIDVFNEFNRVDVDLPNYKKTMT